MGAGADLHLCTCSTAFFLRVTDFTFYTLHRTAPRLGLTPPKRKIKVPYPPTDSVDAPAAATPAGAVLVVAPDGGTVLQLYGTPGIASRYDATSYDEFVRSSSTHRGGYDP